MLSRASSGRTKEGNASEALVSWSSNDFQGVNMKLLREELSRRGNFGRSSEEAL